ncbi:MAG: bifunctional cytidylyltransferase/SDR family oxidoreductase [Actinobacteria bacterium]|nr:bifunctional cytidylyltransferase/SDR family oxidoreductase [Actinomycetota bacterium]
MRAASEPRGAEASPRRNVAVVLAGGVGARVGLEVPKQLIKVAGRTIIEHTIALFDSSPWIDEIVIMMVPGHLDAIQEIVRAGGYQKVTAILEGADTRNGTTALAIAALGGDECNVLFHDAVRPLLSDRIIRDLVIALDSYAAVDTAIPSADTIIQVDGAPTEASPHHLEQLVDVLPRHLLRRGQTPQAFTLSTIRQAYEHAKQDPHFVATDDCTVVLRYLPKVPIGVVRGDEQNMKVTEPIDVFVADKLFQLGSHDLPDPPSVDQYRARLSGKTVVIFGGSYGIGADIAALAAKHGALVSTFTRSTTGTYVERREDVRAACQQVLAETGRIDYVVNTAGVLPRGALADETDDTITHATGVNYLAPIYIAQEFYRHLAVTGGSLLLFTSSSYTRGRAGYSLYSSAKAGLVNLTQALADEWADSGVRVNCINPERTGTPMRTNAFGPELPGSLLESAVVAAAAIDVLISGQTGHIVDVRRVDPLSPKELTSDIDFGPAD